MTDLTVANTILAQMGGLKRLVNFVGAKDFVTGDDFVAFRIPAKTKNGANKMKITLTPMDVYSVEFFSVRGTNFKVKSTFNDVYCDGLKKLFETETGLYLSF